MVFDMYKWIQGSELRPQGRAIVYGAEFEEDMKGLADRSFWEFPSVKSLASRSVHGVFHTLNAVDAVQKFNVPAELLKQGHAYTFESLHTFAEQQGFRELPTLPSYTLQLPMAEEGTLPVTSQEDVIFVGAYHNSLQLQLAVQSGSQLYHAGFTESLARQGTLEKLIQRIPHTFSITSVDGLPEDTPLVPYVMNRFLMPIRVAQEKKQPDKATALAAEFIAFGKGTRLEVPFQQMARAFTRPPCRPEHVQVYQATHCALVTYVHNEQYIEAAETQRLIEAMQV